MYVNLHCFYMQGVFSLTEPVSVPFCVHAKRGGEEPAGRRHVFIAVVEAICSGHSLAAVLLLHLPQRCRDGWEPPE